MSILISRSTRPLMALLFLGAFLTASRLGAQQPVPRLLSYQGVLSDQLRVAVPDGRYTVTFRMYDAETTGTALWEETNVVETIDGVFETLLGSRTALTLPFERAYWLGTQLQGEPEMTPRMRLVSSPYAFRSFESQNAMQLDRNAANVVHTLNALDGNLVLIGEGRASVKISGDTLAVVVPNELPGNARNGQYVRWSTSLNAWEAVDATTVATTPRLTGDGTPGAPLDISQMGATNGQSLMWDAARNAWVPGAANVRTEAPLKGDGATDAIGLQDGTADRQALVWDAAAGNWKPAEQQVRSAEEITGTGTIAAPLRLAPQGATGGQVLRWDDASAGWRPGPSINVSNPPLRGDGSPSDPLRLIDGQALGQLLQWDGTRWTGTTARAPQNGEILRWNGVTGVWEPAGLMVTDMAPLSPGAIWYGNLASKATELPVGTRNQVLTVHPTNPAPVWTSNLSVDSIYTDRLRVGADASVGGGLDVAGATNFGGNMTVTGPAVNLPAGSVDNMELANSSIRMRYGAGVNGDTSVSLGGTLNLRNTGVTSVTGTPNQVITDASTGDIKLSLPQDIHSGATPTFGGIMVDSVIANRVRVNGNLDVTGTTNLGGNLTVTGPAVNLPAGSVDNTELANSSVNVQYGPGVAGDANVALGGTLNLRNTGVTSVAGTPNQVIANASTGAVTLSLPQDIHPGATPTFGGITVDSVNTNRIRVAGNAAIGGTLNVTGATNLGGNLTVTGPAVNLPAGSVDNSELANSSVNVQYGPGVSGDASVVLGGTLNLRNTGVTSVTGTPNQVIANASTGAVTLSLPQDIHPGATPTFGGITVDSVNTNRIRVTGNAVVGGTLDVTGATNLGGNLTVTGPAVNLPAGSVDNTELANSSINMQYGAGVSGDPSVSLGGTLNLQFTGVTSVTGTPNQVIASNSTGDVTLSLPQDIHPGATPTFGGIVVDSVIANRARVNGNLDVTGATNLGGNLTVTGPAVNLPAGSVDNTELANSSINMQYGPGVSGDPSVSLGGTLNLQFTGVTSVTGTPNQVIASNSTGDVTLSLPQDIHPGATPTFGGIVVDSVITNRARVNGNLDVTGATNLGGNLTVTGPAVNLPAGSVDNTELANSSITMQYGSGVSGDPSVSLGGTLNLQFTGVTSVTGTPNQVIASNSTGDVTLSLPQDIHPGATPTFGGIVVDSVIANRARVNGNLDVTGATNLGGNLTVTGPAVNLPAGSVDNTELANSSITMQYGSGVSGDASVSLGGTLNLQFNGVGSVTGTPNQVIASSSTGDITLSLPQDIHSGATPTFGGVIVDSVIANRARVTGNAVIGGNLDVSGATNLGGNLTVTGPAVNLPAGSVDNTELANSSINMQYGSGVSGDASVSLGGTLNLQFNGVGSVTGTPNQVIASSSTGDITLSLPQDIHTGATPTFSGLNLTNLMKISPSDTLLVTNDGAVQARTFSSLSVSFGNEFWRVNGNAGMTPGTNFIGTTDNQALQIHVDNAGATATNGRGRVMRYEPNNTSPNIIGGFSGNNVAAGMAGSTIAGGGRSGALNTISSSSGTIGGGQTNSISTSSDASTVSGGSNNRVGATASNSTISGGSNNAINASSGTSAIAGGSNNTINANTSVISGGSGNTIAAAATTATIAGGSGHTINSTTSVISGGDNGTIGTNARWSAITGGHNNRIADNAFESSIGAGEGNDVGTSSVRGTVGGGSFNDIGANAGNSTISGGYGNVINDNSDRSTIGGGMSNAINTGSSIGTIGGGFQNIIDPSASGAVIGGGSNNRNASGTSTIGGGDGNSIASGSTRSVIAGGFRNYIASGAGSSMITGGESDTINSSQSMVGGVLNKIGTNSTQSTVSGGSTNSIGNTSAGSTIAGGTNNTISDNTRLSAIAGGRGLTIGGRGSFGFLGGNDVGTRNMTVTTNDVAVFGNTDLWLANNDNAPSQIRFFEAYNTSGAFPSTANYSSFEAQTQAVDIRYILPDTVGIVGDVMKVRAVSGSTVTLDWDVSGAAAANSWNLTGNAATTAGTNFIGTTDAQAFQIHVDNANATTTNGRGRVMRYEPNNTSPNIIGGYSSNTLLSGVTGAVIAGGGQNGSINTINSDFGTVSGGYGNIVNTASPRSTISGGNNNVIGTTSSQSTIGGGGVNRIGDNSNDVTISGGAQNSVGSTAPLSVIGGGYGNYIRDNAGQSTIAGGLQDTIYAGATDATIGGGRNNTIGSSAAGSVISGGNLNAIGSSARFSAIAGGSGLTLNSRGSFGFLGGNDAGAKNMTVATTDVAVFGNTDLWLANNDGASSQIRFFEPYGTAGAFPNTANYSSFEAGAQLFDIRYILPDAPGIVGDVLKILTVSGSTVTLDWDVSGASATTSWGITGNAGTTPGTNFVGTTDAQAFQIHVDNANATSTNGRGRVMRFEPNATSANIIGGFSANSVTAGVTCATIAGGGVNGAANTIASNTSTVSGGSGNTIGASSINATIAGGRSNQVGASAGNGTVSGGLGNVITSGDHATINGGFNNRVNTGSFGASMGGGTNNATSSHTTVVGGGNGNTIGTSAQFSTIAGGHQNTIANSAFESVISGGTSDTIETGATYSTIGGGTSNAIRSSATRSTIAGGYDNTISADRSTISGGEGNVVSGARSAIVGGRGLTLSGTGSFGFLGANTGANDMTISTPNVAGFGNTDLWLANNDNAASQLRFYEANSTTGDFPGTANHTSFRAQDQTSDIAYILPASAGSMGDQLTISGVTGTDVTLAWAAPSDRRIKSDILNLNGEDVLGRFRGLELGTWRYTNDPSGRRHYGIMAQDFSRLFGHDELGTIGTDTTVNNLDLIGVSYLAIQGLETRTSRNQTELGELRGLLQELRKEVRELREENRLLREGVR